MSQIFILVFSPQQEILTRFFRCEFLLLILIDEVEELHDEITEANGSQFFYD